MKAAKFVQALLFVLAAAMLCSCWQVAAARAAKKRTTQTGPVMGTIEKEMGVEDPLGREQKTTDSSSDSSETSK